MEYGLFIIKVLDAVEQHIRIEKKCSLIEYLDMRSTAMEMIKTTLRTSWNVFENMSSQLDQSFFSELRLAALLPRIVSLYGTRDKMKQILYPNRRFIRLVADIGKQNIKKFYAADTLEAIEQLEKLVVHDMLIQVLMLR